MAKIVKVIRERVVTYEIDGNPTDSEAIEMAKARMDCQSPLGLVSDDDTVKKFVVAEKKDED